MSVSRRDVLKFGATTPALIGLGFAAGSLCAPSTPGQPGSGTLLFDDFTGPVGSAPNSAYWVQRNNEPSDSYGGYYQAANAVLDGNSNLVLSLLNQSVAGYTITAGAIQTLGKWSWNAGTVSARIKAPVGGFPTNVWSSWWCVGSNLLSVGWPACGEIDIREEWTGQYEWSGIHGPQGGSYYSVGQYGLAYPTDGQYHTFWCTRSTGVITTGMDNTTWATITPSQLPAGSPWVFDNLPMDLVLTLNPGYGANPTSPAVLPQYMNVDWVRVTDSTTPGP